MKFAVSTIFLFVATGLALAEPCACYRERLEKASDQLKNRYEYGIFGPNCNTYAHQIITSLGLPRQEPPVWAPGWDL